MAELAAAEAIAMDPAYPMPQRLACAMQAITLLRDELATRTGERDDALQLLADLTPAQRDRERAVLTAAADVVKVWRQWQAGRGKDPIPVKALAVAVDVMALGPAADALQEDLTEQEQAQIEAFGAGLRQSIQEDDRG